jgi:endonuclease G
MTYIFIASFLVGCAAPPSTARRAAPVTKLTVMNAAPAQAKALIAEHCIGGAPAQTGTVVFGQTVRLYRDGYVLEHSNQDKEAIWVCWHLTADDVTQAPRGRPKPEPFKADPNLVTDKLPRAELSDYQNSGYSRGHQCPSADFPLNSPEQVQTYYLSNMTPQYQSVNGGIWAQLEKRERKWAQERGAVYVITGPLFYEPAEEDPATADGFVNYEVIGTGVAVPTHYYKIVVSADAQGHPDDMVAFVIANVSTWTGSSDPADYRQSVRWIEDRAGLNFMPAEKTARQEQLETSVSPMWN